MRITRKLIDRLAALEAAAAPLAAEIAEIKATLKEAGEGTYAGFQYEAEVSVATTLTLDQKLVKGLLTPVQLQACSRAGTRTNIKVRSKEALRAAA